MDKKISLARWSTALKEWRIIGVVDDLFYTGDIIKDLERAFYPKIPAIRRCKLIECVNFSGMGFRITLDTK